VTSHAGRLYAVALALVVFFVTWAAIAARPWETAAARADPQLAALSLREQRLRHEAIVVKRIVQDRWSSYRLRLRQRERQIASVRASYQAAAAAPSVQIVNLPPLVVTRTS
jgi:hypothetical protein